MRRKIRTILRTGGCDFAGGPGKTGAQDSSLLTVSYDLLKGADTASSFYACDSEGISRGAPISEFTDRPLHVATRIICFRSSGFTDPALPLPARGAEGGFAPGRTDFASLWFLFTHSVSSWSPAVSRRRSASQAWVPYPVFSRVYPHSDRRMPCVSGIIFRQRLQILKQGSPLRTARRNRTVRSNAMRSRCLF